MKWCNPMPPSRKKIFSTILVMIVIWNSTCGRRGAFGGGDGGGITDATIICLDGSKVGVDGDDEEWYIIGCGYVDFGFSTLGKLAYRMPLS